MITSVRAIPIEEIVSPERVELCSGRKLPTWQESRDKADDLGLRIPITDAIGTEREKLLSRGNMSTFARHKVIDRPSVCPKPRTDINRTSHKKLLIERLESKLKESSTKARAPV